ncbi:MAG: triose-phosphate isomerase [Rickettsiales bacterium]|nr:triose-phosphate isomerase [Rickettsiales bacterium]
MTMPKVLIAGNWKMNGNLATARELAGAINSGGNTHVCEYLICPPFTALSEVSSILKGGGIGLGAQDCHTAASGAHTGDVSIGMLSDIGCNYVIVGHSERRSNHGESNDVVKSKATTVLDGGLSVIICVGESEYERKAGSALTAVEKQLIGSLPGASNSSNTVVAYEPIWAIGTGAIPTIEEISEMHLHISSVLERELSDPNAGETRLLYGGSVNPENAPDILRCSRVNGALVGGASLKATSFLAIGESCP